MPIDHRLEWPFFSRNHEISGNHSAVWPNRAAPIINRACVRDIKDLYAIAFLYPGLLHAQWSALVVLPVPQQLRIIRLRPATKFRRSCTYQYQRDRTRENLHTYSPRNQSDNAQPAIRHLTRNLSKKWIPRIRAATTTSSTPRSLALTSHKLPS